MKTYSGARTIDGILVVVDGRPLDPRNDLGCFSAGGFEWTYVGPAPRQLALALLADHLGDGPTALALSDAFMRETIANLENGWTLTSADIEASLARIKDRNGDAAS